MNPRTIFPRMSPATPATHLLAAMLAFASLPTFAAADAGDEVTNVDGSRLRIVHESAPEAADDNDDKNFPFHVEFIPASATQGSIILNWQRIVADVQPYLDKDMADEPFARGAGFTDIDKDGFHDLSTFGVCGAGPNCGQTIFRFHPAERRFYLFDTDFYSDAEIIDGYLVKSSRSSCCEWERSGTRLRNKPHLLPEAEAAFRMRIGTLPEYEELTDNRDYDELCIFTTPNGKLIAPPSPKLLPLCELFGPHYFVVTPEKVAQQARQQRDASPETSEP
ncbi:MAG: hypothetical protein QM599_08805 [Pseudoxanthomonas sp.]